MGWSYLKNITDLDHASILVFTQTFSVCLFFLDSCEAAMDQARSTISKIVSIVPIINPT